MGGCSRGERALRLLRTLILRPLRRDLLRTALTMLSVALGVAVVIAIDLAGDAATGSFRSSLKTLVGKTDLEIVANGGVDERWMGALARAAGECALRAGDRNAGARSNGIGSVPVYGVDCWRAIRRRPLAISRRWRGGSAAKGRFSTLLNDAARVPIADIVDQGRGVRALDIADGAAGAPTNTASWTASTCSLRRARISTRVERAIRAAAAAGYRVEKPGARSEENQRMLRAFRWNLRVLSYISLVVGAFLIYNTISVSVVRRRAGDRHAARAGRGPRAGVLAVSGRSAAVRAGGLARWASRWAALLAEGAVGLIARDRERALRQQPAGGGRARRAARS